MANIEEFRKNASRIAQDIANNTNVANDRIRNRGMFISNLMAGYVKNVEVVIDVTELLNKYNEFASELLKQMSEVNATLQKVSLTGELKDLLADTTRTIAELEDRYTRSINVLQEARMSIDGKELVNQYQTIRQTAEASQQQVGGKKSVYQAKTKDFSS